MFWEALGLLGILLLWGVLGLVPWQATLVAKRGRIALRSMPLAFAAGIAAGALVPALGATGGLGFGLSLVAALAAGAIVSLGAQRMTGLRVRRQTS